MSTFPCLARFVPGSGEVRYRLGDRLVDRYLEFVAGRCRPSTLRAVAFDLKVFFTVVGQEVEHVRRGDLDRVLADHREERLQVERDRPQRVRTAPARHELQIPVCQPLTQRITDLPR